MSDYDPLDDDEAADDQPPPLRVDEFVLVGAQHLAANLVDVDFSRAVPLMLRALADHLQEEHCLYGDADYTWDRFAAYTVADEYVLDHAERAAD